MEYLFDPRPQPWLPIVGEDRVYPVGRIFCVGRNYAAHAAEMGSEVDREQPFYFTKSCHHLARSGAMLRYPKTTRDYHHEIEFVVALDGPVSRGSEMDAVLGYAVGLDMTRRDLQAEAKKTARPWDMGKDSEGSAVVGAITRGSRFGEVTDQRIALTVNGELRQEGMLSDMIWQVVPLIQHLSGLYSLKAGDLIMTGTPSGVGPTVPGDVLHGTVEGCEPVDLTLTAR